MRIFVFHTKKQWFFNSFEQPTSSGAKGAKARKARKAPRRTYRKSTFYQ